MISDATAETFDDLISSGIVLLDVWGPRCEPCLALMPAVEALAVESRGSWRLVKLDATQNRSICRDHCIMGLPTYVFFVDGVEINRLTGAEVGIEDIKAALRAELDEGR